MAMWIEDEEAYFLSQDEDLILAGVEFSALLDALEIVENYQTDKAFEIISFVLVKFRDNDFETLEEKKLCEMWIRNNRDKWDVIGHWDYLKDDVKQKLNLL